MPSSLFHLGIGLLLGAALIREGFDIWAVLAVATFAIFPDTDAFFDMWIPGAHRSLFHNLLIPALLSVGLLWDSRLRDESFLRQHWGEHGSQILWVSVFVFVVAGVGVDLFGSGANLFYPIHDQYYDFSGSVAFSNQDGVEQTIFRLDQIERGSSVSVHYASGVDPKQGKESENVERVYNISANGVRLFISVVVFFVVCIRLRDEHFND